MSRLTSLLLSALLAGVTGCASFSTVFLHRDETDQKWVKERMLHGIPITLKVPTHVKVDLVEKHYLYFADDGKNGQRLCRIQARFPVRGVNYEYIYTEKLFVVDLPRPAAGTIDANIELSAEEQYFKKIKNEVEDTTIQQVSKLIAAVAPGGLFGVATTKDVSQDKSPVQNVKEVETTVASQVFEIDVPGFEQQILAFLDTHLNCCHDCSVLPPGVCPPAKLAPVFDEVNYRDAIPSRPCHGTCAPLPAEPPQPGTLAPPSSLRPAGIAPTAGVSMSPVGATKMDGTAAIGPDGFPVPPRSSLAALPSVVQRLPR